MQFKVNIDRSPIPPASPDSQNQQQDQYISCWNSAKYCVLYSGKQDWQQSDQRQHQKYLPREGQQDGQYLMPGDFKNCEECVEQPNQRKGQEKNLQNSGAFRQQCSAESEGKQYPCA